MKKCYANRTSYLRNHRSYDHYFHFFKILILWIVCSESQRVKTGPNSVCSVFRNHASYDHDFWYKIIISQAMIFWIFRKLGEGMWRKNGKKMTYNYQFQSVTLYISGIVDHIIKIFGTQV